MDEPRVDTGAQENDGVPERLLQLRELVFERWRECVFTTIPEAKELDEKVLTSALNRFYDDLIASLRNRRPYSVSVPGIGSSCCHGRERASSTKLRWRILTT
jgi:hypothetical protein